MTDGIQDLRFSYDRKVDVLTVEGVKYSGSFFRTLAWGPTGGRFEIVDREHGAVHLKRLEPKG